MINPIYKLIAFLIFIIGIATGSYFYGWKSSHDELVRFKAEQAQLAITQTQQAKEKEASQNEITNTVTLSYAHEIDRLNTVLNNDNVRLRNTATSSCSLPKTATSPAPTDGTVKEQPRAQLPAGCTQEFYKNALEDVVKLNNLQGWIHSEGLDK